MTTVSKANARIETIGVRHAWWPNGATRLEPIREVWIHDEAFAAARRLSMMRIMARRTNAATVVA